MIYVDVLFVLNMIVDYFLLLTASKLGAAPAKLWRLLIAAAMGGVYSLFIFIQTSAPVSAIAILAFSVTMILEAFGFRRWKRFLRLLGTFYAATFLYAGIMMLAWFLFKPPGMIVNNGVVYFNLSPLLLVVSCAVCYVVIALLRRILRRGGDGERIYTVTVTMGDATVSMRALLDSGHSLCDLFSGAPVIIAEYKAIERILPKVARLAFATGGDWTASDASSDAIPDLLRERFRLIPYHAVGGKGLLPAFRPDLVTVRAAKKSAAVDNALVAVSSETFGGEYSALISAELIEKLEN